MENRDRTRDQVSPDRPPNQPTPGHENDDGTDPRWTREGEDDRDNERQSPRRDQRPDPTPKTA
jgi:hypothetical protein